MAEYPLLDLQSAFEDAQHLLREVHERAARLWVSSNQTWEEMSTVCTQAEQALQALGALPPTVLAAIAQDRADLEDMEARAPENTRGY